MSADKSLVIICKQGGPSTNSSLPPVKIFLIWLFIKSFSSSCVFVFASMTLINCSNVNVVPSKLRPTRSCFLKYGKLIKLPDVLLAPWSSSVCLG